jgi:hypothetical protein
MRTPSIHSGHISSLVRRVQEPLTREVDALHAGHVLGWRAADAEGDYDGIDFKEERLESFISCLVIVRLHY